MTEPVGEEHAVREPGEVVVQRLVHECVLRPVALGDVVEVHEMTGEGGFVGHVAERHLEPAIATVGVHRPSLEREAARRRAGEAGPALDPRAPIVGVQQVERVHLAERLRRVAEDGLDRGARVLDDALVVDDA